jgi:hypothetical protein
MGTDGSQSIDGRLLGRLSHDIQINQILCTFSTQLIPQVLSSHSNINITFKSNLSQLEIERNLQI